MNRNACLAALLLLSASEARALPAFARLYGTSCQRCHDGYLKLNATGRRFRERGFRFDNEEPPDAGRWLRSVPLSLRAGVARKTDYYGGGGSGSSEHHTTTTAKGVAAGAFGSRFSFWLDDGLRITRDYDGYQHQDFTSVSHVGIDNAWVRLEILGSGRLHLRGGRFELDLPVSQARSPHLFPYEVYSAQVGYENETLGEYREGFEFGGTLPGEVLWSAALVKSRNRYEEPPRRVDPLHPHLFLRLSKSTGNATFGAFAYGGRNTLSFSPGSSGSWEDRFLWLGADANLWVERLNLLGSVVHGRSADPMAYSFFDGRGYVGVPSGQSLRFTAGVLQGDWHVRRFATLTLRLALLHQFLPPSRAFLQPPRPGDLAARTTVRFVPGLHLWVHERLSFAFEFQPRRGGRIRMVDGAVEGRARPMSRLEWPLRGRARITSQRSVQS